MRPVSGHNLSLDPACLFQTSDTLAPPGLGIGGDHGGPTMTLSLTPASPAVDAANAATCEATDQRGVARPQGGACDIGAFELVPGS